MSLFIIALLLVADAILTANRSVMRRTRYTAMVSGYSPMLVDRMLQP